ncbi:3-hydroxyacyl-CoA dehydrogenase family protein [Aquimarina hainanensis]|uniref:3-hydroxyacyl-CoA dehydrogenase family protein n=1 Tax=Aquimarina hainanensis TaxID=1578017 RepID=A0ABW5NA14_9FLAO|nr:3-hydroxyacyl-CoA dehydrogenase NAD-binding domain-containing protein [Aquimarina sp. TRL1]QKX05479.1 3-hydroxybutyryl-CoA dehydrogenase [Aquimarina sp. TRL1]
MSQQKEKIGVIGHGLMGRGIIHSYAENGFEVVAVKRRDNDTRLEDHFRHEIKKGRLEEEQYTTIKKQITSTTDLSAIADCQLIIENISENVAEKVALFDTLENLCPPETIFATNTSSIPIGKMAKKTKRPEKVIGLHYMSPVQVMDLVEIVKGLETSKETLDTCIAINKQINKVPVVVKDFPGFVASRLVSTLVNEASFIYMQGVAEAEAIDEIAKLGMNLPVGPLKLADLVGLDTALYTLDSLFENFKDPKYRANPLLRTMVESGHLGRKTGKGFYDYNK